MAEKRPSFQWYPKDYLTDERVESMTLEEEGAYRRLMDYEWLHKGLPNDFPTLARMCRVSVPKFKQLWEKIKPCFNMRRGEKRLVHPRLQSERRKQNKWREKSQLGGLNSAKARASQSAPVKDNPKGGSRLVGDRLQPKSNTSSPSASSTPVTTTTERERARQIPKDWTPNDHHQQIANTEGIDLDREVLVFRDHAEGAGRVQIDWDAAFRNWLRNAKRFNGQIRGKGGQQSLQDRSDAMGETFKRMGIE